MKSSGRTIRYFAGAALGMMLTLGPAGADSGAAVPLEKENPTVVGVAAGSDAATVAATDPSQPTAKKKKKKAARSAPMVAVPLETVQAPVAPAQAPTAAPAAAAQEAAQGSTVPEPVPAAPAPQGAPPAAPAQETAPAEGAPAAGAATAAVGGASAASTTSAEGTAAEAAPATQSPASAKKKRQLGMRSTTAAKTTAAAGATAAIVRKDIIGVIPPTGRISGYVLAKDGVTKLGGAELILDHGVFGTQHRVQADASGAFDIELPIGRYELAIQRRHEIYESPTSYSVAGRGTLPIDFILLRDFEEEPAAAPTQKGSLAGGVVSDGAAIDDGPERWLPEPHRKPEVVGSVVDLTSPVEEAPGSSRKNGAETMGFLGSLLAILIIL